MNNSYNRLSGTSQATPYVAGVVAKVVRQLKDKGMDKNDVLVQKAKAIVMNTANTAMTQDNIPYSPRQQGAGIMSEEEALSVDSLLYSKEHKDNRIIASVPLKEINNTTTFELVLEDLDGLHKDSYKVGYTMIKDGIIVDINGIDSLTMQPTLVMTTGVAIVVEEANRVEQANKIEQANKVGQTTISAISVNQSQQYQQIQRVTNTTTSAISMIAVEDIHINGDVISLEKNKGSTTFKLDISRVNLEDDSFVEGFITLESMTDEQYNLQIPYSFYKGDFNHNLAVDKGRWEEDSYIELTGLYDEEMLSFASDYGWTIEDLREADMLNGFIQLGANLNGETVNTSLATLSPNSDGEKEKVSVVFTLLRNVRSLVVEVRDEEGVLVNTLFDTATYTEDGAIKYGNGMVKALFEYNSRYKAFVTWDGKDKDGHIVGEGQYTINIKTTLDGENQDRQSYQMPIKVDKTSPTIEDVIIDTTTNRISFTSGDEDILGYEVYVNGEYLNTTKQEQLITTDETNDKQVDLKTTDSVRIVAFDHGNNTGIYESENDYTLTAQMDKTIYDVEDVLTITGQITHKNNNIPVDRLKVSLDINVKPEFINIKHIVVTTDDKGRYSYSVTVGEVMYRGEYRIEVSCMGKEKALDMKVIERIGGGKSIGGGQTTPTRIELPVYEQKKIEDELMARLSEDLSTDEIIDLLEEANSYYLTQDTLIQVIVTALNHVEEDIELMIPYVEAVIKQLKTIEGMNTQLGDELMDQIEEQQSEMAKMTMAIETEEGQALLDYMVQGVGYQVIIDEVVADSKPITLSKEVVAIGVSEGITIITDALLIDPFYTNERLMATDTSLEGQPLEASMTIIIDKREDSVDGKTTASKSVKVVAKEEGSEVIIPVKVTFNYEVVGSMNQDKIGLYEVLASGEVNYQPSRKDRDNNRIEGISYGHYLVALEDNTYFLDNQETYVNILKANAIIKGIGGLYKGEQTITGGELITIIGRVKNNNLLEVTHEDGGTYYEGYLEQFSNELESLQDVRLMMDRGLSNEEVETLVGYIVDNIPLEDNEKKNIMRICSELARRKEVMTRDDIAIIGYEVYKAYQ